jgi:DNA-binding transcriptional LysR family regulator
VIQGNDVERHVADSATLVGDVLDLRALCLVTDLRSFTAAARIMGETKGTVSRRIARLERALGVALLRRSPRLVEATEDGAAYRMHVGRVLELLGDANLAVRRARATPSGHLRVTAPTDLALAILAAPFAEFTRRYPEVRVEMLVTDKVLDFDAEHIDVAFRATRRLPDTSLVAHKLIDLELIAVASPEYLARRRAPRKPDDLAAHRVAYLGGARARQTIPMRQVEGRSDAVDVELRASVTASDFSFLKEVALAGGVLVILPAVLVTGELASGRLVRVLEKYAVAGSALHLVYRGGRFLPPKVRALVDFMKQTFATDVTRVDG